MIVVGVIVLLVVLAVAVTLIASGDDPTSFNLLGIPIDSNARTMYLLGALSVVLLVLALYLIRRGVRRSRGLRKENKTLRKERVATHSSDSTGGTSTDAAAAPGTAHEGRAAHGDPVVEQFDSAPKEPPR